MKYLIFVLLIVGFNVNAQHIPIPDGSAENPWTTTPMVVRCNGKLRFPDGCIDNNEIKIMAENRVLYTRGCYFGFESLGDNFGCLLVPGEHHTQIIAQDKAGPVCKSRYYRWTGKVVANGSSELRTNVWGRPEWQWADNRTSFLQFICEEENNELPRCEHGQP